MYANRTSSGLLVASLGAKPEPVPEVPVEERATCSVCGAKSVEKMYILQHRTSDNLVSHAPICRHEHFITCPDCCTAGCPVCGCQGEYC